MKILVVDFLFVKAHRSFNENVIKALSENAEVDVLNINEFYDKSITAVNYIDINFFLFKSGSLKTRINSLILMYLTLFYMLKIRKKYDAVFCLTFDTLMLACGCFSVFFKCPFYLFHHKNIDELRKTLKKKIFKIYQNKFVHIVFEKEFAQQLKMISGLDDSRVKVVPHPIFSLGIKKDVCFDCVGLCNSNSVDFVEQIEEELKKNSPQNLNFVIRSSKKLNSSGNFVSVNSFLTKEQYWDYVLSAKTVFVALPESYKNRLSGSMYDAFSSKKKVFTTSLFHASMYERLYPGICEYVSSARELIEKVGTFNPNIDELCFDSFIREHSVDYVAKKLLKLIEKES